MKIKILFLFLISLVGFSACNTQPAVQYADGVVLPLPENFVTTINGKQTALFTLVNKNNMRVDITNYGGRIVSLLVPDKNGVFDDVVTGYLSIDEFIASEEIYFGAIIGRYGNRIGNAQFTIDGTEYALPANNGPNHLHGGPEGFHTVVWDATPVDSKTLKLTYNSPHLEQGYPGNVIVEVVYQLNDDNELVIKYAATTDQKTVLNLTNHAFFNLGGEGNQSINEHFLKINASFFTPVDQGLIPTGELASVSGTPFDFLDFRRIGERINADDPQLILGAGYDHNFVLNRNPAMDSMEFAAAIYEPKSGRKMEVFTTEPGIQFYGGNFLTGKEVGKRGEQYLHRTSFCLETQHFPDAPNKHHFPSTILEPGDRYQTETIYRFSVMDK